MSLPKAIHTLLSSSSISDLVGNRILPVYAPLNTDKPFIIYKLDALSPTETKDSSRNMDIRGLTIMCYADNYNSLHTLFDTIRTEIARTHETVELIKIDSIILKNQDDDYDPDNKVYFGIQNFNIRING